MSFGKGVIAVTYLKNAANVVEVFDFTGKSLGVVSQPGIGAAAVTAEIDRTEAYLTFTSFTSPTTIFRIDLARPQAAPELWERPDVPVDPAIAEVEQVWYPSKDGTRISMFLVHKKGLTRNGDTPTLPIRLLQHQQDAGVFGHVVSMDRSRRPVAEPNLRGGGEYGDEWHEGGMLGKKQNVFDDFIAAAEWLIANRHTNPQRLEITGASNGGLLAAATLHSARI